MTSFARTLALLCFFLVTMSSSAHSQDRLTTQALERIQKYEKLEPDLEAGDVKTANLYLNQIGWAAKRLNASSEKSHAVWKDASKRYQDLVKKIQAKAQGDGPAPQPAEGYDHQKLVALNTVVGNAMNNLKILNVSHLMDEGRVRGIRKELADFETRIGAFPVGDDNVKLVTANIADFRKLFETGMAQLKQGQDQMGEVTARLETLSAKYKGKNQPKGLEYPFDEAQLRSWAAEIHRWRNKELPTDIAWLQATASNPAVDSNKINGMYHWLSTSWASDLEGIEHGVRERIAGEVWQGLELCKWVLETNPDDQNHVLGRILGKGSLEGTMGRLQAGQHAVQLAVVFDQTMGYPAIQGPRVTDPAAPQPEQPDRAAQKATVDKAIQHLTKCARKALDEVRVPKPASTDAELLKAAEEALRKPANDIKAKFERIVISVDKARKESRQAYVTGTGANSATVTYYEYVWDQMQVTTAEKVGDEIWLYSHTLKYYHSGDPTTVIGSWRLTQRFQLTPILPENLNK